MSLPDPAETAARLAEQLRVSIETAIPPPPDFDGDKPQWVIDLENNLVRLLDTVHLTLFNDLHCALSKLDASVDLNDDGEFDKFDLAEGLYRAIRDIAYAGVPYSDVTYRLEGSFSYTGLSSFASITGGAVVSTSGATGIVGSVDVFGIPTGKLSAFMNQTDADGNPSPSICGSIDIAIGPLEIGNAELKAECPGCMARLLTAFEQLATRLSENYIDAILLRVAPELVDSGLDPVAKLAALNDVEKQRFLGEMLTLPPVDPEPLHDFLIDVGNAAQPAIAACGEVRPRIFGFTPSGDKAFFGTRNYIGPANLEDPTQGFDWFSEFRFSPLTMLAKTVLLNVGGGPVIDFVPAVDQATAAVHFNTPAFGELLRDSLELSPDAFVERQFQGFIDSAAIVVDYELSPLGLELGRSAGRILFPSYDHHPKGDNPKPNPEDRGLPSRLEVLLALLGQPGAESPNLLGDTTWRNDQLQDLVPTLNLPDGIDLVDDYFPHGGLVGASQASIPRLLSRGIDGMCQYDGQPCVAVMLDENEDGIRRVEAGLAFFNEAGQSDVAGELGFYIPAPNPPSLLANGAPTLQEMLDEFRLFEPDALDPDVYPLHKAFMTGYTDIELLGLPTLGARLDLNLDYTSPLGGRFQFVAEIPEDSWLATLVGGVDNLPVSELRLDLESGLQATGVIPDTLEALRQEAEALLAEAGAAGEAAIQDFLDRATASLRFGLPRGSIDLDLLSFAVPLPVASLADFNPQTHTGLPLQSARMVAYTPGYAADRPQSTGDSLVERLQHDGGVGITGNFQFDQGGISLANATGALALTLNSDAFGLPGFAGEFTADSLAIAGITPVLLDDIAIDVTSTPTLFELAFSTRARSLPIGIGTLVSTTGSTSFDVRGSVRAGGAGFGSASVAIGPARLAHPAFGSRTQLLIHGSNTSRPFTLNTDGPWSANATLIEPELDFEVGGTTWLRVTFPTSTTVPGIAVSGNGASITSIRIDALPTGATVTSFPGAGDVRERTFRVGTDGTAGLRFGPGSDFELTAEGDAALAGLVGFPGAKMDAGYALRVSNDGFELNGKIGRLTIPGATLEPRAGDSDNRLGLKIYADTSGNIGASLDPAALDLTTPVVQSEILIDGGTSFGRIDDLSIQLGQPWTARVTVQSLTLDADGNGSIPTFMQVSAVPGKDLTVPPLATLTANFNGLDDLGFDFRRSGSINVQMLPGTALAQSYSGINPGNQRLVFDSSNGFRFSFDGINPGGFSLGSLPNGSGSVPLIEVTSTGSASFAAGSDGFSMTLPVPQVRVANIPLLTTGIDEVAFSVSSSGTFAASLKTNRLINLFGTMLQLRTGTHTLSGSITNLPGTIALDAAARIRLAVPRISGGSITTSTLTHNFTLQLDAGQPFAYTWDPTSTTRFDIGWAKVEPGAAGRVNLAYNNGAFSVEVRDWDAFLFGTKFDNAVDMSFSSSGFGSSSLGSGIFDFAEGLASWIRITTGTGSMPLSWNAATGTISTDFPTQGLLTLPGAGLLSGTLKTGIDIPTDFPPISTGGTFDHRFDRTITINGVRFGSIEVRLQRTTINGDVTFSIDHDMGGDFAGVTLDVLASTSGSFDMRLTGQLEIAWPVILTPTWGGLDGNDGDGRIELASIDLDIRSSETEQFRGTTSILGLGYTMVLGTDASYVSPRNIAWARLPLPALPE